MNIEKINVYAENLSGYSKAANDELNITRQDNQELNTVNPETDTFIRNKSENFSSPVKIYAESAIKNAVKNIEKGLDVEENKKIIRIYSNIIKENPENILRNKFYI